MKILITGGSGLLGTALNIALSKTSEFLAAYNKNKIVIPGLNSVHMDITNYPETEKIITAFRPDIIIHTAALSRNDQVNSLPYHIVQKVNIGSVKNLSQICSKLKAKLIFTSTDLVYDGNFGSMLNESSPLMAASLYAETKILAENEIKNTFDNFIILRTSLLYGIGPTGTQNHFARMLTDLQNGKEVKLFYDQYRTPLSTLNAAQIISHLCNKEISGETINFGGIERVSRYELGEILCEVIKADKKLLIKTSMNEVDYPPVKDVSMDTSKLKSFGIMQNTIHESIREILNDNNS